MSNWLRRLFRLRAQYCYYVAFHWHGVEEAGTGYAQVVLDHRILTFANVEQIVELLRQRNSKLSEVTVVNWIRIKA